MPCAARSALETPEKALRGLNDETATLVDPPARLASRGAPSSGRRRAGLGASLFDFGLVPSSTTRASSSRAGAGPYFYLPKLERHHEARLWDEAFTVAEDALGCRAARSVHGADRDDPGRVRDGRDPVRAARPLRCALNAGRWDYIFSCIKKFARPLVLPDRAQVTMTVPFMRAYTELLVKTCHERGAHAIGGMAAFIPSRRDPEVNEIALAKVRGGQAAASRATASTAPGSRIPISFPSATREFDAVLGDRPNQLDRTREDDVPDRRSSSSTSRSPAARSPRPASAANVCVGVRYLDAWLQGSGAAAIDNLMEDAATAEIARAQVWSWVRAGRFTEAEVRAELHRVDAGDEAKRLFVEVALSEKLPEFLTLSAYPRLGDS